MVSTEVNGHLQLLDNHPDFIFKPVLLLPTNLWTTKGSKRNLDWDCETLECPPTRARRRRGGPVAAVSTSYPVERPLAQLQRLTG